MVHFVSQNKRMALTWVEYGLLPLRVSFVMLALSSQGRFSAALWVTVCSLSASECYACSVSEYEPHNDFCEWRNCNVGTERACALLH